MGYAHVEFFLRPRMSLFKSWEPAVFSLFWESQTQCLTEVFRFEKFYVAAITANLTDAKIRVAILLKFRSEAFQNLKIKFLFYLHGNAVRLG